MTKSYAMGREDRIMGKQWARQLFKEKRNPQTTHLRSLRTLNLSQLWKKDFSENEIEKAPVSL